MVREDSPVFEGKRRPRGDDILFRVIFRLNVAPTIREDSGGFCEGRGEGSRGRERTEEDGRGLKRTGEDGEGEEGGNTSILFYRSSAHDFRCPAHSMKVV